MPTDEALEMISKVLVVMAQAKLSRAAAVKVIALQNSYPEGQLKIECMTAGVPAKLP